MARASLDEAGAALLRRAVARYNAVVVTAAAMEKDATTPPPLLAFYSREEFSAETLVIDLVRLYRGRGVSFKELAKATGFKLSDVKEMIRLAPRVQND